MTTAPFWRLADKLGFVVGVAVIVSFSYLIGKFPHDIFYTYYVWLITFLFGIRLLHYHHLGWHWFILDFCYYANYMVVALICFWPKSDLLLKISFLYSEGVIGISIWLFRNSLVFHKIDILTNLAIHIFPMLAMYHVKWFTIEDQMHLPESQ